MNSLIYKYPLDYDGTNPQNVVSLPITLTTGNPNRASALPYGPMFADTVRVTNASSPATPLIRGKDYQLVITNPKLIERARGREIVHGIVVFNEKVSNQIVVTGNIVGGPFGANLDAIEQLIDAINADTRQIKWSDLKNVPSEYVAAPAYYDVGDIYGFEYIIMAMGQIESAIRLKDNAEMVRIQEMIRQMREELLTMFKTHVDAEGNVHKLTRTQLNVYSTGEVDNIFSEAIKRFNTLMVEIGKLENADAALSTRIDGVYNSTANYVSQIVESNLEHQKNTLEIARVSEGVAAANKRINDAIKLINKNTTDIATLQKNLNTLSQSVVQGFSEVDNRITKLENRINDELDVINERLEAIESKQIGETYVQFPGCLAPAELFGGSWRLMFDNEGVFFRTEGGQAIPFGAAQIQGDAIREMAGNIGFGSKTAISVGVANGVFAVSRIGRADRIGNDVNNTVANLAEFRASRVVPTAEENRPKNRTIRVWLRIAD